MFSFRSRKNFITFLVSILILGGISMGTEDIISMNEEMNEDRFFSQMTPEEYVQSGIAKVSFCQNLENTVTLNGSQLVLHEIIITDDYFGAIDDFTTAIRLEPKNSLAYLYRGVVRIRVEEFVSALSDLNTYIELNPENDYAYLFRGKTKDLLEDSAGAKEDSLIAAKLGNNMAKEIIAKKY